jgi:hypothetical protein
MYLYLNYFVSGRCAFGIDTDMQNDVNNIYLRKSAATFETDVDRLYIVKLASLLPCLECPIRYVYLGFLVIRRSLIRLMPNLSQYIEETPGSWLIDRVKDVVDHRVRTQQDSREKCIDLLQLMIDASTDHRIQVRSRHIVFIRSLAFDYCSMNIVLDEFQDDPNDQSTSKLLHRDEVISNVFLFMIAGYETTSTALAYATYILATRVDIQTKLFNEIEQHNIDDNEIEIDTYETINSLVYLDLFVREVLRMYPITSKGMTRVCNTTTNICGHTVEKGQ